MISQRVIELSSERFQFKYLHVRRKQNGFRIRCLRISTRRLFRNLVSRQNDIRAQEEPSFDRGDQRRKELSTRKERSVSFSCRRRVKLSFALDLDDRS